MRPSSEKRPLLKEDELPFFIQILLYYFISFLPLGAPPTETVLTVGEASGRDDFNPTQV